MEKTPPKWQANDLERVQIQHRGKGNAFSLIATMYTETKAEQASPSSVALSPVFAVVA